MLDISMPVMNGSKATRQIRTRAPATAVLIVMPPRVISRARPAVPQAQSNKAHAMALLILCVYRPSHTMV